jgi:phage tail sheath protein FI
MALLDSPPGMTAQQIKEWRSDVAMYDRHYAALYYPGVKIENPIGINCIRPFGTRGIRVWGARTLSSNTDWRYVSVRRLFNMIETTIMQGTQFAVFEPNDEELWDGVSRTVSAFLRGLWMNGALFGASAEQAYYVKCDAETNPPESIDEGKMIVEVGIAPVKPAEFVIFRIAQHKQSSGA